MGLWCANDPKGRWVWQTLNSSRQACIDSLFDYMPESFRMANWKDLKSTRKNYRKLGYSFVPVYIKEYDDE